MSEQTKTDPENSGRHKLGLALSGGGFRASLFHIGVLARMAELDVLGKVEVLSTVSGGSIVGAMYYLLLKEMLENNPQPTANDYVLLVQRLEKEFFAGVQYNLRTRIISNLFRNVQMLATDFSRTDRIGRLYNKYFYREVWQRCTDRRQKAIPLKDIKIMPSGYASRDDYNSKNIYKIPMLVINATTLNTGKNWRFTASEIGDPDLGFIRFDDAGILSILRQWLFNRTVPSASNFTRQMQELAAAVDRSGLDDSLRLLSLRDLHRIKVKAWLAVHATGPVRDDAIRDLEGGLQKLKIDLPLVQRNLERFDIRADEFFRIIYLTRMARRVSDSIERDMERVSLEEAVGASSAVPGVFQPVVIRDLFDDSVVEVLRLADGGVYDNQGLTALFEEGCTHIVCSDASGQLVFERASSGKIFGVLPRTNAVLMEKIRADEIRELQITHDTTEDVNTIDLDHFPACAGHPRAPTCQALDRLSERYRIRQTAFFHLRSHFPSSLRELPPLQWRQEISEVRTDLDSFSEREGYTLMYHGYYLGYHTINRKYFSDFVPQDQPPNPGQWNFSAIISQLHTRETLRHLRVGASKGFKVFLLNDPVATLLVILGLYFVWLWIPPLSVNDLLTYLVLYPTEWIGGRFSRLVTSTTATLGSLVPVGNLIERLFPEFSKLLATSIIPLPNIFDIRIPLAETAILILVGLGVYGLWKKLKTFFLTREFRRTWKVLRLIPQLKRAPLVFLVLPLVWAVILVVGAWIHLRIFDQRFLRVGKVRR